MLSLLSPAFLLPLLCAILYPLGTLSVKRALDKGADVWSLIIVNCWMSALVFFPVVILDSRAIPWHLWYQPASMALFSFLGQVFAFKAISSGDLTITTPALGSKVLLVALLTELFLQQSVPLLWWIAAGCSFAAVFFLQSGVTQARGKLFRTLLYSLLAAAGFALGDVLIQKWSPGWGVFHFIPGFAICSAFYSLALWPFVQKPKLKFPAGTWMGLLGGSFILGFQSLLLTIAIGLFGQATQTNIIFSSRGLWNFLLVWFLGHWFANREREAGTEVMRYRLIGAGLMFAAIVLASLR
jgi:drug/metabolite transporter (DMT)-like permease